MKTIPQSLVTGIVGEYRVMAELLLKGQMPFKPALDYCGVDLMLESGIKIQIKTTRLCQRKGFEYCEYRFNITRRLSFKRNSKSEDVIYQSRAQQFSDKCDFVILHGLDQNRNWIVPAVELDGRSVVSISDSPRWIDLDIQRMKKMSEDGMTQRQIAKELGVGLSTVQSRLSGKLIAENKYGELISRIQQYENRWDLLASYSKTISEANEAATPQGETKCQQV